MSWRASWALSGSALRLPVLLRPAPRMANSAGFERYAQRRFLDQGGLFEQQCVVARESSGMQ